MKTSCFRFLLGAVGASLISFLLVSELLRGWLVLAAPLARENIELALLPLDSRIQLDVPVRNLSEREVTLSNLERSCGCALLSHEEVHLISSEVEMVEVILDLRGRRKAGAVLIEGMIAGQQSKSTVAMIEYSLNPRRSVDARWEEFPECYIPNSFDSRARLFVHAPSMECQAYASSISALNERQLSAVVSVLEVDPILACSCGGGSERNPCLNILVKVGLSGLAGRLTGTVVFTVPTDVPGVTQLASLPFAFHSGIVVRRELNPSDSTSETLRVVRIQRTPRALGGDLENEARSAAVDAQLESILLELDEQSIKRLVFPTTFSVQLDGNLVTVPILQLPSLSPARTGSGEAVIHSASIVEVQN